jgi:hypothetical protein
VTLDQQVRTVLWDPKVTLVYKDQKVTLEHLLDRRYWTT